MPDFAAISPMLGTADGCFQLSDAPHKKRAAQSAEFWNSADSRFVWPHVSIPAPGGTGTGLRIGAYWDPTRVQPDLNAIAQAIHTTLPAKMSRADNKATYKARSKKTGFYLWQGVASRELCQWFMERFGVYAYAQQVFDAADLRQNVAAVVVKDGVDYVWAFGVPE